MNTVDYTVESGICQQENSGNPLVIESRFSIPLIPDLAYAIGDREAMIVQQIHYWVEVNKSAGKNFHDGRYWVYNTFDDWQKNNFYWLSLRTIKEKFSRLESMGIIMVGNYNKRGNDKTKWYCINYEALKEITDSAVNKLNRQGGHETHFTPMKCDNCTNEVQKPHYISAETAPTLPEITTETTSKTTPENTLNSGFQEDTSVFPKGKRLYNRPHSADGDIPFEKNLGDSETTMPDMFLVPRFGEEDSSYDGYDTSFSDIDISDLDFSWIPKQPETQPQSVPPSQESLPSIGEKGKEGYRAFPLDIRDMKWANRKIVTFMNEYTKDCVENQRGIYKDLAVNGPVRFKESQIRKIHDSLMKYCKDERQDADTLYDIMDEHFGNRRMLIEKKTDFNLNHFANYDILVHYAQNLGYITQPHYGHWSNEAPCAYP